MIQAESKGETIAQISSFRFFHIKKLLKTKYFSHFYCVRVQNIFYFLSIHEVQQT